MRPRFVADRVGPFMDALTGPDELIHSAIDAAHKLAPDGEFVVFERQSLALVPQEDDSELGHLPWPRFDIAASETLLELLDPSSHGELQATFTRAQTTTAASTTALTITGQPALVTIFSLSADSEHAIALIDTETILPASPSGDRAAIRTRFICSTEGKVLATAGSAGSYAEMAAELGRWGHKIIAISDRDLYDATIDRVLNGEPYASAQLHGAAPSLSFEVVVARLGGDIVIDLHDHSHRIAAIDALKRSQTQFNQLSETLPVGVFVVGPEGKMQFVSEQMSDMFGPRIRSTFGWLECIHADDRILVERAIAELPAKRHFDIEVRGENANGSTAWYRMAGSDLRSDGGALEAVVGFVEDVSEWRALHKRIEHQASFDGLTELPNRTTLVEELRTRLEVEQPGAFTAVLFIDLDGFKLINDTQGHTVGDIVLIEVANRFRRAVRPLDLIGRFGGDEFVVVASDVTSTEEVEAIGRRLHDVLTTPVLAQGRIISVNTSIGIALSEPEISTSEQLIGDADIAMYEAKALGRNRSVVFDMTLRARASQRFDMTADLLHARRRRELRLEYQPIVDLSTDAIVGAEALVRWEHPAMGLIDPATFVPLAEEIGLIDDIGEWVVEQSCADLDRLRAHGLVDDTFVISVNASALQFANVAGLATSTLAALNQYGLRPSNLRFELTESVPLTQIPEAATRIRQLTHYGFGLAIDDFGTGYSSLGYLTMLPFDVLKLDLSLTAQLEPGAPALAVVDSLTRMSHEMGFTIVAEGIETDKQHALLTDAGVQLGQGFLISQPVPLSDLMDLLIAPMR